MSSKKPEFCGTTFFRCANVISGTYDFLCGSTAILESPLSNFSHTYRNHMQNNYDMELTNAHSIGLKKRADDVVFSHNKKLFRTKLIRGKLKTKLICNVLPQLIAIENKGTEESPSNEYLFSVECDRFNYVVERYFKPKSLTSNHSFTTQLMKIVPFGSFCGNKEDFNKYLKDEIDRYQKK